MALTDQDIGRIAHLARLELSADESKRMLTRLNGFFGTVEAMCAVDTQGVEPLTQPIAAVQDVHLRLRDDVASAPAARAANPRSAPAVDDGLSLVPQALDYA